MKPAYIFIAMFRAMDCLYEENPSEALGNFLSEANPYLFKDHEAADPAIQQEFFAYLDDVDSSDDSYTAVKNYLTDKGFGERFSEITRGEWEELCRVVEAEECCTK